MDRITLIVDVLLPLPLEGKFTYRVPVELNPQIEKFKRVVVQFGKRKVYAGLVINISQKPPDFKNIKYILGVLDDRPVINQLQFDFWSWLAAYYLSTLGELMHAALPAAFKLSSESSISLHPDYQGDVSQFSPTEMIIIDALSQQEKLSMGEVEAITERKKVMPVINTLIDRGIVVMEEELKELYKPLKLTFLSLSNGYQKEEKLEEVFSQLEKRAPRQLDVLMDIIRHTSGNNGWSGEIRKSILVSTREGSVDAAIKALEKKGIIDVYKKEVSRLSAFEAKKKPGDIVFSEAQQKAFLSVKNGFSLNKTVLLHGVTSSGKTEIYIRLMQEVIEQGKQVLYLLPEIALTTQIINRLRAYFGKRVGVYHSRYHVNERVETWNEVKKMGKFDIIIGPRSALFLPYQKLGLVIVDEEHDYSYKQYDPAPRYHARDAAVYLASLHKADTLLGSATPSIESYFNVKIDKYYLVELDKRYGDVQLPEILVADLVKESRRRTMKSHFSSLLLEHMADALKKDEQVILFQNRRGFSLRIECDVCHHIPECRHCDVTLTYHKHINLLKCHYCGYTTKVPSACESCGSPKMSMQGYGTEKIEEEIAVFFPEATVRRMDLDTTRSKNAHQKIIADFEDRKIDILVGTQMVSKGLDFDNVSVVGILNADNMIYFPDFRSFERSYQMMAQVSGRAGRKNKRGKVIIQSFSPYHAAIRYVMENNYQMMYQSQIEDRQRFRYPPFIRMVRIKLKHKDKDVLASVAAELSKEMHHEQKYEILGPEYPLVARIRSLYIKQIMIKLARDGQLTTYKKNLLAFLKHFFEQNNHKSVSYQIDVDPL